MGKKSNSELELLRAQVLKERSRVTRRINQIRKGNASHSRNRNNSMLLKEQGYAGADISNTQFDPRPDISRVGKMTKRQLEKSLERMQVFRHERETYYAGSKGSIIRGSTMLRAIRATEDYNRQQSEYREKNKTRAVPWIGDGLTAEDYDRDFRPKRTYLAGEAFYDTRERKLPTPKRFTSDDNAQLWADSLREKLTTRGHSERIGAIRNQISQMIDPFGDVELQKFIDGMSNDDLYFLWTNDPTFANALSLMYEHAVLDSEGSLDSTHFMAQAADNSRARIEDILTNFR